MFKTLAPYAQHSIVEVKLLAESGMLRVHINRKPDDENDEKAISLSLLNTPESLDAELGLALAEHFLEADTPKSVAEQVNAQAAAGDDSAAAEPKVEKPSVSVRKVKARAPKIAKLLAKAPRKAKEKPAKAEKPETVTKPRKGRKRRLDSELPTVADMRGILADSPLDAQGETKPAPDETKTTNPETNPPLSETAAASSAAREGAPLPCGVTREVAPPDTAITGDGTGQSLPAIPVRSRDASTLDLF